MHKITMLGAGLIGRFYTISLQRLPGCQVRMICSATEDHAQAFAKEFDIPYWNTSIEEAIRDPETDTVMAGGPPSEDLDFDFVVAVPGDKELCCISITDNQSGGKMYNRGAVFFHFLRRAFDISSGTTAAGRIAY